MRLLVVLPSYEPAWSYGGVVTCMSILCRSLVNQGIDVTVYTTNASGAGKPLDVDTNRFIDVGGVHVCYFKPLFGSKGNFASNDLIDKMRETIHRFDIVYISAIWQWLGVKAANMCISNDIPYIIGTHGSFAYVLRRKSKIRKTLFKRLFLDRILKNAAAIHITAYNEQTESRGWLGTCRCVVVPNAVDENKFLQLPLNRQFRQKHKVPIDALVMITVGRADWKKRTDVLIQAVAQNENWYLVVVGPTDAQEKTREWKALASSLNVSNRVVWTGFLSGDELLAAYSAADLFALVSENENFGMVVVEAMLCGLPVMVSKDVEVWELLCNDNVGICVEKNHKAIASALHDFRLIRDKLKSSKQIRNIAVRRFSPSRVGRKFSQELVRITGKQKPG